MDVFETILVLIKICFAISAFTGGLAGLVYWAYDEESVEHDQAFRDRLHHKCPHMSCHSLHRNRSR